MDLEIGMVAEDTTVIRDFCPGDRYVYDFTLCKPSDGWAQIDTGQCASYFGEWANPELRWIFSYIEGDLVLVKCASNEAFVRELREKARWNDEHGWGPMKIDGMCRPEIINRFKTLGLEDLLH